EPQITGENIGHQLLRRATTEGNTENWRATAFAGSEIDHVTIRCDDKLVNLLVKAFRQLDAGAGRAVVGHQPPAIRFKTCGGLRTIEKVTTIARVDWADVVA